MIGENWPVRVRYYCREEEAARGTSNLKDSLSGKQHRGPLKTSTEWPAPEGTELFEESYGREGDDTVVCTGRLL